MTKPASGKPRKKLTVKKQTLKDLDSRKPVKGGYFSQGYSHCNDNTCVATPCLSCVVGCKF